MKDKTKPAVGVEAPAPQPEPAAESASDRAPDLVAEPPSAIPVLEQRTFSTVEEGRAALDANPQLSQVMIVGSGWLVR